MEFEAWSAGENYQGQAVEPDERFQRRNGGGALQRGLGGVRARREAVLIVEFHHRRRKHINCHRVAGGPARFLP